MEQKNRFLSLGIALGLIAGLPPACWSISSPVGPSPSPLAPAWACLEALSSALCWTAGTPTPDPGISHRAAGSEIPLKKVRLFSAHILVLSIE